MSEECGVCACCQRWERRWQHLLARITAITVDLAVSAVLSAEDDRTRQPITAQPARELL